MTVPKPEWWSDRGHQAAKERLKQRHASPPSETFTVSETSASSVSYACPITPDVPSKMSLSETLRKNANTLPDIPLTPLRCKRNRVREAPPVPFDSAMEREARSAGRVEQDVITVVFVVRRPGCVACREHGLQLSELVLEFTNVSLWAIVKETGIEERGILSFQNDFFCFPVYKDQ